MGAAMCLPESEARQTPPVSISIDLQNPRPRPEEHPVYQHISQTLSHSHTHLDSLRNYAGCGDTIRAAISRPSPQTEEEAWRLLVPAILQLKLFYDYSNQIDEALPRVLAFFADGPNMMESVESLQATAKRVADVLFFASVFDELKIMNPNIQNEFSYYRRALQKVRISGNQKPNLNGTGPRMVIDDVAANNMSMFYAEPAPMLKMLISCCSKPHKGVSRESISDLLSLLAAACYNAISKKHVVDAESIEYHLRVLVMCIVLYDHVDVGHGGAFGHTSKVDENDQIKSYIKLIQTNGGALTTGLINSVRYSTCHLNEEGTPHSMREFVNDL
ncbi:Protein fam49a [Podochytrium sp. JEL0797]|nr:Protein fam49a [Podochytrium sp. JEL0797]